MSLFLRNCAENNKKETEKVVRGSEKFHFYMCWCFFVTPIDFIQIYRHVFIKPVCTYLNFKSEYSIKLSDLSGGDFPIKKIILAKEILLFVGYKKYS